MRKLSTREYVLTAMLGLIAVFVIYFNRGGGLGGRAGGGSADDEASFGEPPIVYLDRLAGRVVGYDSAGRNLFDYYTPPPPKVVRKAPPPAPKVERRPPPKPKPTRREPPKPTGPTPPAINFQYLGYLGPKQNKIAVFEQGQSLVLARAGEVVQRNFRVIEFGYESITMGYVDERFKDETTELRQKPGSSRGRR